MGKKRGFLLALFLAISTLGTQTASAQEYSLALSELAVYDVNQGPASGKATHFEWQRTEAVRVHLEFLLNGQFEDVKKLSVFVSIKDGQGEQVLKSNEDYWVYPGQQVFDLEEQLTLAELFGPQRFTLRLEAEMKGFAPIVRDVEFSYTGAPRPRAYISNLELLDAGFDRRDIFGPGDAFEVVADIVVIENKRTVPLRFFVESELEPGDRPYRAEVFSTSKLGDEEKHRALPSPEGTWSVGVHGDMPTNFPNGENLHPFRITVYALAGKTVIAQASTLGVIRDTRPPHQRRGKGAYVVILDNSSLWDIREESL